ncbi:hypothetical protein ASG31_06065 [Chryseobacterium sp. Leaf404]|uniref:hypothetical protein n=1 Tax=unclassified Chryseobacterium TaxID=2593645 RepID=UPI0006F7FADA|nr:MULTISPECIES: hypothetical protein [unclassified Chryseobacterium]KQT18290.1 hypothetical protein ASG31_06065 [Chryseobacterium sp. Leaf404]
MKTYSVLLLVALSFQSCTKEKTSESLTQNQTDSKTVKAPVKTDKITISSKEDIQKYYGEFQDEINKKVLDSVFFEYECDGRVGNVTYYSKNSKVKVIKHSFAQYSHYSADENYYLNEEKPFFILKEETVWSFNGGTSEKPETKDDITESRIYLAENKVIDCLEKKYTILSADKKKPDVPKFPNYASKNCKSKELLAEFGKIIKNKNFKKGLKQCF